MVVLTRSAYRKATSSSDTSNDSQTSKLNSIPPWCSGKVCERKKPRKATWEIRSSYPLRENIWEYLQDKKFCPKKRRISCKQAPVKNKRRKTTVVIVLSLVVLLSILLWTSTTAPDTSLMTKVISRTSFVSLLNLEYATSVDEECCYRMKHLADALMRAEEALRSALRLRKSMMLTAQNVKIGPQVIEKERYIQDAIVTKGSDTTQWGGRVALWGVVPLWRAAPPPDTVLASRQPAPSDCWPFSGSYGELNFEFPEERKLHSISIEHVRPDIAKSAPKHFVLFGVLENYTWITTVDSEYRHNGPAKQYYRLMHRQTPLRKLVFRVLTNQGNAKYTCIYRVYLYENLN